MRPPASAVAHVLGLALLSSSACHRGASSSGPNAALDAAIHSGARPAFVAKNQSGLRIWEAERRFYTDNGARLVWSDGPRAAGLDRAIRQADQEGLDPNHYQVNEAGLDRNHAADVDLRLTYAYLSYAWDLVHGASRPEDLDPQWYTARDVDRLNVGAALRDAVDQNRVEESLARLAPAAPQYLGLKQQLRRYREMGDTARARQIAVNMDRWRWLPDGLGSRYLIVNIPAYRLDVVENGRSVLGMKVVVGKRDNPTPVLADEMTSVVFSPYWNIPQDIVQKEILPHVARDPAYLDRNNIELVRTSGDGTPSYRQKPGAGNSLGFVKFIFPNHFNVYLHDTPAPALFNRIERDFSHGCVRIERPMDLARYVLRDQPSWTDEKIEDAMHAGTERSVALKTPLPVYLVYFTVWEENGDARFADDVYGYDRRQGERD